ncbi:MAG TPA: MlaD family protein [Anaeromyxobacteraceae bacterium]|nr:MlaD family protein [Anaeromyxobacteraceae bacterium]
MRGRPNLVLVGAFVLGLAVVGTAVGLWLASGGISLERHDRYIARFDESVTGLSRGAQVKYRGVPIGIVREMALDAADPERVRLVLEVKRGTLITEDTVAVLVFQGLTGIATVDLAGGGRSSAPLAPTRAEPYPVIRTAPSTMKRLELGMTKLLADLGETARSANALLGDDTRQALRGTVADLQQVVHAFAGKSSDVEAAVGAAAESLGHAAEASARLPGLIARIGRGADAVERVADEVGRVGVATRAAVDEASGAARDASRTVEQLNGESLVELQRLLAELTEAATALGRISRELERNRGALFGAQQPPPGPGE